MHRRFLLIASLMGALAVILGAFGSHVIKTRIDAEQLAIYETASKYHFYHTLALLATGMVYQSFPLRTVRLSGIFFIAGTIIFSSSLYLLAILGDSFRFLGAITPIGGILLILGWCFLLGAILSKRQS